jgi:3-phosphoshikimate 1-carboxyvinyltransferase
MIYSLSPLVKPVTKTLEMPGCLSYTTRALILAALSKKPVKIFNPLKSDDVYAMIKGLQTLGIRVDEFDNLFEVVGSIGDVKIPENKTRTELGETDFFININLSGRTARSILPLLCLIPGDKILTGAEPFLKRPMGPLIDGLTQLGAEIEYLNKVGFLPVKIKSSVLKPGKATMPGNISAQFFAGIMMIAPAVGEVVLEVVGNQVSKPYIDITTDIMQTFGVKVDNNDYKSYKIASDQNYNILEYTVEGDYSTASYFAAIAVLTKSKITLKNLNPKTVQGDKLVIKILEDMGNTVEYFQNGLTITGKALKPVEVDMEKAIDQPPCIAVLASFADGVSKITGIETLKYKESNRLLAVETELEKMNIKTESDGNNLTIFGGKPMSTTIQTYHDHRIAMAFAVAGSLLENQKIENPEVVNKSFPKFWEYLEKIGIKVDQV